MEILNIEQLSYDWNTYTYTVIEFGSIELPRLQKLFKDTYNLLDEFGKEKLVPKQICRLLIEMHDFSWWVCSLDETPLHEYYQEIVSLITALIKYFLTRDYDVRAIEEMINNITVKKGDNNE